MRTLEDVEGAGDAEHGQGREAVWIIAFVYAGSNFTVHDRDMGSALGDH